MREKLSSAEGDGLGGDDEVAERVSYLGAKKSELQQVSREAEEGAGRLCEMDRSTVSLPLEISAITPACMLSILLVAGVSYLHKN